MWGNVRKKPLSEAEKAILAVSFDIFDTWDFNLRTPMNKLEARLLVEEHKLDGIIADTAVHLNMFGSHTNVGFYIYKDGEPADFIFLSKEEVHPFNPARGAGPSEDK